MESKDIAAHKQGERHMSALGKTNKPSKKGPIIVHSFPEDDHKDKEKDIEGEVVKESIKGTPFECDDGTTAPPCSPASSASTTFESTMSPVSAMSSESVMSLESATSSESSKGAEKPRRRRTPTPKMPPENTTPLVKMNDIYMARLDMARAGWTFGYYPYSYAVNPEYSPYNNNFDTERRGYADYVRTEYVRSAQLNLNSSPAFALL